MEKEEQVLSESMNLYSEEDMDKMIEERLKEYTCVATPQLAFIQTNAECAACC